MKRFASMTAIAPRILSYPELWRRIASFACHLRERGIRKGDRLLLWGENGPEWVAVFWSCVSQGVQVVPVDPTTSPALVERIQAKVQARLLVHGREVRPEIDVERLAFRDLGALEPNGETLPRVPLEPDDPGGDRLYLRHHRVSQGGHSPPPEHLRQPDALRP